RFIVTHQAFGEGLARQDLQFGVERSADGKAALVKLLLAVALIEIAAHFLGEILGGEDMAAGGFAGHAQGQTFGFFGIGGFDEARLCPAIGPPNSSPRRAPSPAGGAGWVWGL